MKRAKCPGCQGVFHTANPQPNTCCPFCGYSLNNSEPFQRKDFREPVERPCTLSNGFGSISGNTIDISKSGVGVKIDGEVPFNEGNNIRIGVDTLSVDNKAEVMWVKHLDRDRSNRVGLKFDN